MAEMKIALSIEEAADYTGIGRNTLRKLVEWNKLPVLKVGRKVLIKKHISLNTLGEPPQYWRWQWNSDLNNTAMGLSSMAYPR